MATFDMTANNGFSGVRTVDRNPREALQTLASGGLSLAGMNILFGTEATCMDDLIENDCAVARLRHMKSVEKVQAQPYRLRVKHLQREYDVPLGTIAKMCRTNRVVFQQILGRDRGFISLPLASAIAELDESQLAVEAVRAQQAGNLQFEAVENLHRLRSMGIPESSVTGAVGIGMWRGEVLPVDKLRQIAQLTPAVVAGRTLAEYRFRSDIVIAHIHNLVEHRTWADVAAAAKMPERELRALANVEGAIPYSRVGKLLELRLYQVRPSVKRGVVPAELTLQRVRSLATMGYSAEWLKERLRLSASPGKWRGNTVNIADAATIAAFYNEFHMTFGPSDATRSLARQKRYPSPLTWDDEPFKLAWEAKVIDLPDLDSDEEDFIDEVAVDVACDMTMDPPTGLTQQEKKAAVRRLLLAGHSLNTITERARVDRRLIITMRKELGIGADRSEDD